MTETRGRQLLPGQTSRVHVYDVETRTARLVFASDTVLVEAPNVLDADTLVLNGDGDLWLLPLPEAGIVLDETALVPVPMDGVPEINNDHVLDPSGGVRRRERPRRRAVPRAAARRGERASGSRTPHAPCPWCGSTTCTASPRTGRRWPPSSATCPRTASGRPTSRSSTPSPGSRRSSPGTSTRRTDARTPETCCCSTPSGSPPGTAQLAALRDGSTEPVQITGDERVNWFPHVSPDGIHLLYLSYEPGVQGHPADHRVELRLLPGVLARGARIAVVPETLVALDGGQGTVNVPPWAPDSSWFAYCDYPVATAG
ncbi:hypothetical protein [Curtobacterium sp. MCPF17_052]|uniref:TolB family protein n=1 Tax=Curtobacterium sp. MCPF17_052 TaxID=2175655 RepID=UPI0024DF8632|nr:hypothetical protein [Curtobacterium sp. MCPF17_052]WIB13091.1 hypothetical protein DEJ36_03855 [Curtobacterium sp. MCPF17_052]